MKKLIAAIVATTFAMGTAFAQAPATPAPGATAAHKAKPAKAHKKAHKKATAKKTAPAA